MQAGDLEQARVTLEEIQDEEELAIAVASIAKAESRGNDSRTAKTNSKPQSVKESDLIASFAAAHTLGDWQKNEHLQRQLWNTVTIQLSNGRIADTQRMLNELLQLAAQQFRSWAVNAPLQASRTPKE